MAEPSTATPPSGERLARNTLWNLVGQIAPLLAAVLAIPALIDGLGVERFGVLTLAWMVIGYFSLFDLGLGRALIKLVSEKLGASREGEIPQLLWTALLLMLALGLVGGSVIFVLADWLVASVLNIAPDLQSETLASFRLLALSVPIVILTTGLRGVLEAYQRFDLVNLVRVPMGILTFVSPLAVLPFSTQLDAIVLILLVLRILVCAAHAILCIKVVPGTLRSASFSRRHVRPMLGFGGWMTVTNLVGPLMVYLDRFVIGSLLGMAAVAYYVTPYEVITKILALPGALVGVLFPAFSASLAGDRPQAVRLFDCGVRWVFLAVFPIILVATVFASEGLQLWLTADFSKNSAPVLQWLAAGVLLNGLANIPFAFIQAAGRPDLTAKLHLAEFPIYLVGLWLAMAHWGLMGAAIAWTLRAAFDALALFVVSALLEHDLRSILAPQARIAIAAVATLTLGHLLTGTLEKTLFAAVTLGCFAFLGWRQLMSSDERAFVRRTLLRLSWANHR